MKRCFDSRHKGSCRQSVNERGLSVQSRMLAFISYLYGNFLLGSYVLKPSTERRKSDRRG